MAERKVIEINHALSGIYGKDIKNAAQKTTDARYFYFYNNKKIDIKTIRKEEKTSISDSR